MDQNEKDIIANLFRRLQEAETKSGTRDAAAESLIHDAVASQPAAPYYMAQAILVQEHALKNLNARVEELERELAQRPAGGGFLAGLFGGSQSTRPAATDRSPASLQPPMGGSTPFQSQGRGSFLGSALQTAAVVAGGVLLGNAIAGFFSEEAQAAEAPHEAPPSDTEHPQEVSPAHEEPSMKEDFGGFGDFGGEDDI